MINFICGAITGIGLLILLAASNMEPGGTLGTAQGQYRECLSPQAPADVCLKAYLLPKESRP